jgi:hypothetical protein
MSEEIIHTEETLARKQYVEALRQQMKYDAIEFSKIT